MPIRPPYPKGRAVIIRITQFKLAILEEATAVLHRIADGHSRQLHHVVIQAEMGQIRSFGIPVSGSLKASPAELFDKCPISPRIRRLVFHG